ncbi:hypothetical protein Emag_001626 [Eimeria magna]
MKHHRQYEQQQQRHPAQDDEQQRQQQQQQQEDWHVGVGSYVREGALLAVVETDKVSVEINAAASGRIAKSHAAPGETVFVGRPLYELDLSKPA